MAMTYTHKNISEVLLQKLHFEVKHDAELSSNIQRSTFAGLPLACIDWVSKTVTSNSPDTGKQLYMHL